MTISKPIVLALQSRRYCSTLNGSEAGFSASQREDSNKFLLVQIYELIKKDKENANYGVRRIYDYLRINKSYLCEIYTIGRIYLMIRPKHRQNGITEVACSDGMIGEVLYGL